MPQLKLGSIQDQKPVRITVELPASLYRDLVTYAELMSQGGKPAVEPAQLVAPMLERFIRGDRAFARARRGLQR